MNLTPEIKVYIDTLDYEQLLRRWRFATTADDWMTGEVGQYWGERMNKKKEEHPTPEAVSKKIGWK